MLAGRRHIPVGAESVRTPILVPSFSSKSDTGWTLSDEIKLMEEHIATPVLLSAYDIHYGLAGLPDFPSLLFLDSGGYEAHRDVLSSERGEKDTLTRQPWNRDLHEQVLAGLRSSVPIIAVSYDHPNERTSIADQIAAARATTMSNMAREILFKPDSGQTVVSIQDVVAQIDQLDEFAVLGFTDKELGRSMQERLVAIATLRKALQNAGRETAIHVFGSLDPITSPLYFLAGADVFDGLAWLRYAMDERGTTYLQNYGVLECGLSSLPVSIQAQAWVKNFTFLTRLQGNMRSFLRTEDYSLFGPHGEFLRKTCAVIEEEVEA